MENNIAVFLEREVQDGFGKKPGLQREVGRVTMTAPVRKEPGPQGDRGP